MRGAKVPAHVAKTEPAAKTAGRHVATKHGVAWVNDRGEKVVVDLSGLGVLDRLIEFKVYQRQRFKEEAKGTMQVDFNITVRVDFADEARYPVVETAVVQMARHMQAQVALLNDKVKPEVLVNADDFVKGHKEISLIEDLIQQGIEQVQAMPDADQEETVSADLLAAVQEMRK